MRAFAAASATSVTTSPIKGNTVMDTPIDPIRIPTITLSNEEIDEIKEGIKAGQLPADFLERHYDAVDANVFGIDAPKDRHGKRQEQGRGSRGHETLNHFLALRRAEAAGLELPGAYDRAIAAMWKDNPRRAEGLHRWRMCSVQHCHQRSKLYDSRG
jgi:hypothetical protein